MTLPQSLSLQIIRPSWNMKQLSLTVQSIQNPEKYPWNETNLANVRCKCSTNVSTQNSFSLSQSRLQLRLFSSYRTRGLRKEGSSLPEWESEIELQPVGMRLPFLRYVECGVSLPIRRELKSDSNLDSSQSPGLEPLDAFSKISLAVKANPTKIAEPTEELVSGGRSKQSSYLKECNESKAENVQTQGKTVNSWQNLLSRAGDNARLNANKVKFPNPTKQINYASRILDQSYSMSSNETHGNSQVKTPYKSLYDELFPEEDEEVKVRYKQAVVRMETLPVFNWNPKSTRNYPQKMDNSTQRHQDEIQSRTITKYDRNIPLTTESLGLLSLDACSCSLEESDFFRLGPKGEHIETWTTGIVKVVPVRDELTLRAKGSYVLLFSSEQTAEAYRNQISRLHGLSKTQNKHSSFTFPIQSDNLREKETLDPHLKDFSLVPGYSRLTLRAIKQPLKPLFKQTLEGGPVAHLKRKTASEHLVLLYLDIGNISMRDVEDFITEDGKRRNLYWKLVGGPSAIYEVNKNTEQELQPKDDVRKNPPPTPLSYVLPFLNEYEARRFVREWHRRQFPFPGRRHTENTYHPIINAEILW